MMLDPKALQKKVKENLIEKPVLKDVKFLEQGTEVEGQIYVKKLSFTFAEELEKSYTWKPHEDDDGLLQLDKIDVPRLKAAHILATICTDEKGTAFFENIEQVFACGPDMCRTFWEASNAVNVFWGKSTTKNSKETKSLQNSQSTESVETVSLASETQSLNGNMPSGVHIETVEEA